MAELANEVFAQGQFVRGGRDSKFSAGQSSAAISGVSALERQTWRDFAFCGGWQV